MDLNMKFKMMNLQARKEGPPRQIRVKPQVTVMGLKMVNNDWIATNWCFV